MNAKVKDSVINSKLVTDERIKQLREKVLAADAKRRHRDRVPIASEALARLTPQEFIDVVLDDLVRRGADDREPRGLFLAATVALHALLREDIHEDDHKKARRLALVARGVRLRSETQDEAPMIREIAEWIDASLLLARKHGKGLSDACSLLRETLAKELKLRCQEEQLIQALKTRTHLGRTTNVVMALDVLRKKPGQELTRREVQNRVKSALNQ